MKVGEQNLAEEIKNRNAAALEYAINNYGKLIYKIIYNTLNSYGDKESIQECVMTYLQLFGTI